MKASTPLASAPCCRHLECGQARRVFVLSFFCHPHFFTGTEIHARRNYLSIASLHFPLNTPGSAFSLCLFSIRVVAKICSKTIRIRYNPVAIMESEAQLLARCRQGETAAWDALFDQHYAAAGRFVFQLASDFTREDVEEVCQETFLSVIRNLHSFQGQSQFRTWLFHIAANKARDFREKKNAAKRGGGQPPLSLQAELEPTGSVLEPPDQTPAPDLRLIKLEQAGQVREAVALLDAPCREIIELRYFGDLSYDELSRLLALHPKTVSSRLSKCLDKLELIVRRIFSQENSPNPV